MTINRLAGIAILIVALIMGCSRTYGTINEQSDTEDKITLAELRENWEEYTVYQSYRWATVPSAIVFDPKDDDKKIIGDSWYLIKDQETLSKSIREIQQGTEYDKDETIYAKVEIVKGPDDQIFGYMYYPSYLRVIVKMVDERTLYVGGLPGFGSAP